MYFYTDPSHKKMFGPISKEQLQTLLASGRIPADTIVRQQDGQKWQRLGEVISLTDHAAAPPTNGNAPALGAESTMRKLLIIAGGVLLAAVIAGVGYGLYAAAAEKQAEQQFVSTFKSVRIELIELATESETMANRIQSTWHDAIFDKDKSSDFNDQLAALLVAQGATVDGIRTKKHHLREVVGGLSAPVKKKDELDKLRALYLDISQFADLATEPTGSYQSYSQLVTTKDREIAKKIEELDLIVQGYK